jgi:hypothetical protein
VARYAQHWNFLGGTREEFNQVSGLAAEGLDLAIVYLAPPLDPTVLVPLAEALDQPG